MITSFYAGLLAILFFKISIDTIMARRKNKISLGSGPNNEIEGIVSAHANFTSYAIYLLVLTYLIEQSAVFPSYLLHIIAAAFTIGRVLHYLAVSGKKMNFKFRVAGMQLTLWPLLALGIMNIYAFIRSM